MIDLKDLRRRITGAANDQGVCGPTWINPREAVELLDMIDAANLNAARYQWLREQEAEHGIAVMSVGEWVKPATCIALTYSSAEELDAAIDAAMAATKGEA